MKTYLHSKLIYIVAFIIFLLSGPSLAKEQKTYNTVTVDISACIFSRLNIELTKGRIRLVAPFQKDYPDMVTIPGSHPKCHADNMSETRLYVKKPVGSYPAQTNQLSFVINAKKGWKKKGEGYVWESYISKLAIYHDPILLTAESYESNLGNASIYMINRDKKWNIAAIEPNNGERTENRETYEPDYYDWQFIYAFEDFVSSGVFQTAHITIKANAKEDIEVNAVNEKLLLIPKEDLSGIKSLEISVNGGIVEPTKRDGYYSADISKETGIDIHRPGRILNLKATDGDTGQNIRRILAKQSLPNMIDVKHNKSVKNFRLDFDYIYFADPSVQENQ